jgi:hypothetical protein
LMILRDTPRGELQSFFDDQERNLHEDWNKDIELYSSVYSFKYQKTQA